MTAIEDSGDATATDQRGGPSASLGCAASLAIAVLGTILLLLLLSIALRGEARFTKGDLGEWRVWLIREADNQGIGTSNTSVIEGSERSGRACVRTRASFVMLRSQGPNEAVTFCECFEKEAETWVSIGACASDVE